VYTDTQRPFGRLALLDVQIGYPADLSNLGAFRARLKSDTGTRKTKKATQGWRF